MQNYEKIIIVHQCVEKETILMNSFLSECCIRKTSEYINIEDLENSINLTEIKNLAFIYHFPGNPYLPFYLDEYENMNDLEKNPYMKDIESSENYCGFLAETF